jgi:hypothetical protein
MTTVGIEKLRQFVRIKNVEGYFDRDHEVWMGIVRFEDLGSGYHCFGGLCLASEEESKAFVREVCHTFDVLDPERLAGVEALLLLSDHWTPEGLEAKSGKRFTRRGFLLRNRPGVPAPTPTEYKCEALTREFAQLFRRSEELSAQLADLTELTDWETAPAVPWSVRENPG